MLQDTLLSTGQTPPQRIIMPKMITVLRWRNPPLVLHIQIFPGFCHDIPMNPQVHLTHCCMPSVSHSTWPVVGFVNMVFYFFGITSLRKIPIEKFMLMQMVLPCLHQLVYTPSFIVTYFYIIFCINFHLEWIIDCHF